MSTRTMNGTVDHPFDGKASNIPKYMDSMVSSEYSIYWNSYLPIFFDRMNATMRKHMTDQVKEYGITSAHAVYLIALVLKGKMSQMELSQFLDMDAANTNRVVKVLREKGMVYDDRATPDARNYKLHLTEIGKKIGNDVMESTTQWMEYIMSDIDKAEVISMRNTLLKIMDKMDPFLNKYMASKYVDPFYTYLNTNPYANDDDPESEGWLTHESQTVPTTDPNPDNDDRS